MTVEQAADAAGMHPRHWQKLEAGDVGATLSTLARLAVSFDVDAADLLREPK